MIETWQIVLAGATLSGYLLALLHDDNQESMFLLGLLGALCLETTLWCFYRIIIRPRFISPLRHIPTSEGNHWLWGHGMKLYQEPYCSPVREWYVYLN
jgi:hypothetical protein